MADPDLREAVARAICIGHSPTVHDFDRADAALQAISAQGYVVVPQQPAEAQWGGLARDIMMWLDMNGGGQKTPRALFTHLERLGREIPQWLRDEPEMKHLDHVPSKGTRVAIIYKAMLPAPTPNKDTV